MIYIDDIIYAHKMLIEKTGGASGLRNRGLLESALAAPFASFGGIEFYSTIQEKAAKLAYAIINNHPFVDGNKRIGVLTMVIFLEAKGIMLDYSDEDLIKLGLSLADGTYDENDVLEFILKHEK
jgi:death-on-curing protein